MFLLSKMSSPVIHLDESAQCQLTSFHSFVSGAFVRQSALVEVWHERDFWFLTWLTQMAIVMHSIMI